MSFEEYEHWPFDYLGLKAEEATHRSVKRNYARKLKEIDQEGEPEEFQRLRSALETANALISIRNSEQVLPVNLPDDAPTSPPDVSHLPNSEEDDNPNETTAIQDQSRNADTLTESRPDTKPSVDNKTFSQLSEKCLKIRNLECGEPAVATITEALADPRFNSHDANRQLGIEVADFLIQCLEYDEDGIPTFADCVSIALLQKLDLRYQWFSDFRALEHYTACFDELYTAAELRLGRSSPEQVDDPGFRGQLSPLDRVLGIMVLSYVPAYVFGKQTEDGSTLDFLLWLISTSAISIIILIVTLKIIRNFYHKIRNMIIK